MELAFRREQRYLLGLRPSEKRHGGLWEFPGGKLAPGESLVAAARRELAEELDLDVTAVGDVLRSVGDRGSPFVIEFVEAHVVGDPVALEHEAVDGSRWRRWIPCPSPPRMRLSRDGSRKPGRASDFA